jgi:hypothetical protein
MMDTPLFIVAGNRIINLKKIVLVVLTKDENGMPSSNISIRLDDGGIEFIGGEDAAKFLYMMQGITIGNPDDYTPAEGYHPSQPEPDDVDMMLEIAERIGISGDRFSPCLYERGQDHPEGPGRVIKWSWKKGIKYFVTSESMMKFVVENGLVSTGE